MNKTLKIKNMKCGGCVSTVSSELSSLQGVSEVIVTLEDHLVAFEYDSEETLKMVKSKLTEIGHPEDDTNDLLSKAKSLLNT